MHRQFRRRLRGAGAEARGERGSTYPSAPNSTVWGSTYGSSNGTRWLAWTMLGRPRPFTGSMVTRWRYAPVTRRTRKGPCALASTLEKRLWRLRTN